MERGRERRRERAIEREGKEEVENRKKTKSRNSKFYIQRDKGISHTLHSLMRISENTKLVFRGSYRACQY